jgi:exopolyphosphatase/guanosine-5'-triphosphate,3'-diphosphate pyrophosphatase
MDQQLTKAALSLGRRYMFDEAHGLHVARLALSLFDQLQELHGLGPDDRRYLLAASILHDIGAFVDHKKHHKHSLYLISRSELPGLSANEMLMVANIARYHRKNIPRKHHPDFMRLSEEDRDRTTALSAILRIADALDRSHLQHVEGIRVIHGEKDVTLVLEGEGDRLLERWAVSRKTGLFSRTFHRSVAISA